METACTPCPLPRSNPWSWKDHRKLRPPAWPERSFSLLYPDNILRTVAILVTALSLSLAFHGFAIIEGGFAAESPATGPQLPPPPRSPPPPPPPPQQHRTPPDTSH